MDRSLSNAARRRFERLSSSSALPPWFPAAATVLGIVLAFFLVIQLMVAHPHATTALSTPSTIPTSSVTSSTAVTSTTATTTAVTSTTATTTAVENVGEDGSTNVPTPAVTLAERVALAEVTGRAAGIPLAASSSPVPHAAVPYAHAALQSILLSSGTPDAYSFLVTVSTGPSGATGTYAVSVVESHGWKYSSALG